MAAMRYYGNVMTTTKQQYSGYALLWNRYDRMVDGGSTPPYKKETSSVYDCTVEDVEYICNSNSTVVD